MQPEAVRALTILHKNIVNALIEIDSEELPVLPNNSSDKVNLDDLYKDLLVDPELITKLLIDTISKDEILVLMNAINDKQGRFFKKRKESKYTPFKNVSHLLENISLKTHHHTDGHYGVIHFLSNDLVVKVMELKKSISFLYALKEAFFTQLFETNNEDYLLHGYQSFFVSGDAVTNSYAYVILERLDIDLYDIADRDRELRELDISLNALNNIIKGVQSMHKYGLVHRDIKLENIMIKNNKTKLIDFGLTEYWNGRPLHCAGTPVTMSDKLLYFGWNKKNITIEYNAKLADIDSIIYTLLAYFNITKIIPHSKNQNTPYFGIVARRKLHQLVDRYIYNNESKRLLHDCVNLLEFANELITGPI